jgi:uncharacterized RDD family membrane protein YckC
MQTDPRTEFNPYAPPSATAELYSEAPVSDEFIPAERSTRLGALLLDGLVMLPALIPNFLMALSTGFAPRPVEPRDMSLVMTIGLGVVIFFGLLIYQWYLISTRGQSLGKKWLGIKIVRTNGEPVGFLHGVILRSWIITALGSIPYVGGFIHLVDALMIFGSERQCLHDQIAGTKVVLVLPQV